jgi:hypothetical protein
VGRHRAQRHGGVVVAALGNGRRRAADHHAHPGGLRDRARQAIPRRREFVWPRAGTDRAVLARALLRGPARVRARRGGRQVTDVVF